MQQTGRQVSYIKFKMFLNVWTKTSIWTLGFTGDESRSLLSEGPVIGDPSITPNLLHVQTVSLPVRHHITFYVSPLCQRIKVGSKKVHFDDPQNVISMLIRHLAVNMYCFSNLSEPSQCRKCNQRWRKWESPVLPSHPFHASARKYSRRFQVCRTR